MAPRCDTGGLKGSGSCRLVLGTTLTLRWCSSQCGAQSSATLLCAVLRRIMSDPTSCLQDDSSATFEEADDYRAGYGRMLDAVFEVCF